METKTPNFLFRTDSYKWTHHLQMKPGVQEVHEYLESRGGKFPSTLFFGLQYIIKKYLTTRITPEMIDKASHVAKMHFMGMDQFNRAGWKHIVDKYDGRLPLEIKAVKEGTVVPVKNVLMTMRSTDDKCTWLPGYLEGLLQKVWAPTTVATNSHYCKKLIKTSMLKTGSRLENLNFKLHDFGYRGVSSEETAEILSAAHMVSFEGSDTLLGMIFLEDWYNWDLQASVPSYSVPASEHFISTVYGRGDGEKEFIMRMLEIFPDGIYSAIGDTYDIYNMAHLIGTDKDIRDKILSRKGCFVLRLDSGEPIEVINKVLNILWDNFGGTYTAQHFKLLNDKVRILQGDGIDYESIVRILMSMESNGFATDNIVFGSGGGLLQKHNRDTQKFAIKCNYCIIDGQPVNVLKDPITDPGKKSKSGILKLHPTSSGFITMSSETKEIYTFNSYVDALEPVFYNGEVLRDQHFSEIRQIAKNYENF